MENWSREEWETINNDEAQTLFYLYTPMCGTCQVATKMLSVIKAMKPNVIIGKADLNYMQDMAIDHHIESVPCLILSENGVVVEKIYAFHSIQYLLGKID